MVAESPIPNVTSPPSLSMLQDDVTVYDIFSCALPVFRIVKW